MGATCKKSPKPHGRGRSGIGGDLRMLNLTSSIRRPSRYPGRAQRTVFRLRSGRSPRLAGVALPVVLPGGQAANVKFSIHEDCRRLPSRQVPGRLRCQARRATRPAQATPNPTTDQPRADRPPRCSLSRPAGGALDLDFLPFTHVRSRRDVRHRPQCAWRTTGGRTTFPRGAQRRRARVERDGGRGKS